MFYSNVKFLTEKPEAFRATITYLKSLPFEEACNAVFPERGYDPPSYNIRTSQDRWFALEIYRGVAIVWDVEDGKLCRWRPATEEELAFFGALVFPERIPSPEEVKQWKE